MAKDRSLPVKLREWVALAPLDIYEKGVLTDGLIFWTKYTLGKPNPLVVWPSVATIAALVPCSRAKAFEALASLREKGYITPVGKTEFDVVMYKIELGHYHAPKIRLPKRTADPVHDTDYPQSTVETTPVCDMDHPSPQGGLPQSTVATLTGSTEQVELNGLNGTGSPGASLEDEDAPSGKTTVEDFRELICDLYAEYFDFDPTTNTKFVHHAYGLLKALQKHGVDPFEFVKAVWRDWPEFKAFAGGKDGGWLLNKPKEPKLMPLMADITDPELLSTAVVWFNEGTGFDDDAAF